jgi:nucleoid DNA-binding protein
MDIGLYIADLLSKQDEVSLPGLGIFSKVRVAGSFDQSRSLFLPPVSKIFFNDTATGYSSLADHISAQKNISPSSSEYFIRKFTTNILEALQNNGLAEVKPLGILHKNQDKLVFEASADFIPDNKHYGLRPIAEMTIPLFREAIQEEKKDIFDDIVPVEPENSDMEEEEADSTRSATTFIWIAVLSIVIAAGLLYVFNPQVMSFIRQWSSPAVSTSPAPANDSVNKSLLPAELNPEGSADSTTDNISADSSLLNAPTDMESVRYEIIGAGFGRRADAEIYVKELNSKGISAKIVEDLPGQLTKVSLGTFSDYQQAETELIRIREELNDQAWIASINPKKTH